MERDATTGVVLGFLQRLLLSVSQKKCNKNITGRLNPIPVSGTISRYLKYLKMILPRMIKHSPETMMSNHIFGTMNWEWDCSVSITDHIP
jgi:hypothetical protein